MNKDELLQQVDKKIAELEEIKYIKQCITNTEELISLNKDESYALSFCGNCDLPIDSNMSQEDYIAFKRTLDYFFADIIDKNVFLLQQKIGPVIMPEEYLKHLKTEEQGEQPQYKESFTILDVKKWVSEGKTLRELKILMGKKNDPAVYAYFDKYGIDTPTRKAKVKSKIRKPAPEKEEVKEYPPMTIEAVRTLYTKTDAKLSEVARTFGKTKEEVYEFIGKNGLKRTDKRDEVFSDAERTAAAKVQA